MNSPVLGPRWEYEAKPKSTGKYCTENVERKSGSLSSQEYIS